MIKSVTKTDALKKGNSSLFTLFVIVATKEDHWKFDVFKGTHCGEKVESLENEADMSEAKAGQERVRGVLIDAISHDK